MFDESLLVHPSSYKDKSSKYFSSSLAVLDSPEFFTCCGFLVGKTLKIRAAKLRHCVFFTPRLWQSQSWYVAKKGTSSHVILQLCDCLNQSVSPENQSYLSSSRIHLLFLLQLLPPNHFCDSRRCCYSDLEKSQSSYSFTQSSNFKSSSFNLTTADSSAISLSPVKNLSKKKCFIGYKKNRISAKLHEVLLPQFIKSLQLTSTSALYYIIFIGFVFVKTQKIKEERCC